MIAFYLMTSKGFECLKFLIENKYAKLITCVIGSEDKSVQNDYYIEIKAYCENNNIPFHNRLSYSDDPNINLKIAISWRWIIPNEDNKLIVLHDSLLPKYRGFAPLVNALVYGEQEIGVTAIFASEKYDEGDVISQSKIEISYPIKISDAIDQILICYFNVLQDIFEMVAQNQPIIGRSQDPKDATYSIWRDEDDYRIDWSRSAAEIRRFVDAVGYPYQGAFTTMKDRVIRVLEVQELSDVIVTPRDVGKIIYLEDKNAVVICGHGLLQIKVANDEITGNNIYPLKNFRIRFK